MKQSPPIDPRVLQDAVCSAHGLPRGSLLDLPAAGGPARGARWIRGALGGSLLDLRAVFSQRQRERRANKYFHMQISDKRKR